MVFLAAALLFAVSAPAGAQVDNGSITGIVHDVSGAVIPSAVITIRNLANGFSVTVKTNEDGIYQGDEWGLTNFRSPSFDPATGLFIVNAHPSYSLYFAKHADGDYGWAGADYILWGTGILEAIDYQTGKIRWSHDLVGFGSGAGVLTTDGGLTFTGDVNGNVLALDTRSGKTLWHAGTGTMMMTSPITYELDGRQYVMTSSGGVLFAWALPQAAPGL